MTPVDDEAKANEIVIIRRRGGGEEAPHKGGVWKIAYADFMTAMMAFFLVMWLINATDKRVITQVATYFNPLKLTDKSPHARGLHEDNMASQSDDGALNAGKGKTEAKADRGTSDKSHGNKDDAKKGEDAGSLNKKTDKGEAQFPEETLYRDPQGTLAKLAEGAHRAAEPVAGGEAKSPAGIAYRDPFDPSLRTAKPIQSSERGSAAQEQKTSQADRNKAGEGAPVPAEVQAKDAQVRAAQEAAAARADAAALDKRIRQALAQSTIGAAPHLDVTATEEGLLVSLTDDFDFGMFAIASAEPRPAMVLVMETLARVLGSQSEPLVIRGHTDGRPYRGGTYDNWRLSAARAHMAYLMLRRGGVDEARFERIEGHADHLLKIPSDREAAQNRRIEILLRKAKP